MLTFFRRIRRKLLGMNKIKEYLLYALGEIVLVVIGILIALQINNWNEARKENEKFEGILNIIKKDLEADIQELEGFFTAYQEDIECFNIVLDPTLTLEELKSCHRCAYANANHMEFIINDQGYQLFKNFTSDKLVANDSLLINIDEFYRQFIKNNEILSQILGKATMELVENYKNNYDWYMDFTQDTEGDDFYKYILTSQESKNNMAHTRLLLEKNYVPTLKVFRDAGIRLVEDIDKRLHKKTNKIRESNN